jgi:RNA polymerase sigma factor (sigma-70 family)
MKWDEVKDCRSNQCAMQKAIDKHERLIWYVIHSFKPDSFEPLGLEKQDFYQLAIIGFIKAIHNFNPTKKTKFVTFATLLMGNNIKTYLMRKSHTIRIPDKEYQYIKRIRDCHSKGMIDSEICNELNITLQELEKISQCSQTLLPFEELDCEQYANQEMFEDIENMMLINDFAQNEVEFKIMSLKYKNYTVYDIANECLLSVKEINKILKDIKNRLKKEKP